MNPPNREKLQELLCDFYTLAGIKICLYDSAQNELCYYPEKLSPFCRRLREDADMHAKCAECDRRAFAGCTTLRKRVVHTCHAGLLECFAPILCNDAIVGYIVIGQIRGENIGFDAVKDRIPERLHGHLKEAFEQLPVVSGRKIGAAIRILDACAGYEFLKSVLRFTEKPLDVRIAEYIEANLTNDLSVGTLCRVFHLSRSEIYGIFRERFDSSVAGFVKERRLRTACELLTSTDVTVGRIAGQCGIPDYNYFSKQFKKRFGVSPTRYRMLSPR